MKKVYFIIPMILCFSMLNYSCKSKKATNDYCVKVIQSSPKTFILPDADMNVIQSLCNRNGLDHTKYQFYQLDTDDLGFRHVRCYQYINGLKAFSEDLIFHFNKNDSCYLSSGNILNASGLDAKPSMKPNRVVEVFVQKITQEKTAIVDENRLKGCFEIELGCAILGGSNEKLTKVWKVKPVGKDYPFAYINDDSAEMTYYDNGIRF